MESGQHFPDVSLERLSHRELKPLVGTSMHQHLEQIKAKKESARTRNGSKLREKHPYRGLTQQIGYSWNK